MLGAERLEPRLALAAVQATFTADNHYGLYYGDADGTRLTLVGRNEAGPSGSPGTYNWSAPESFSFDAPSGSHLYVVAWDSGQWQMVAGQFSVAGGQTIGTSASAWQCLSAAGTNPGDTGGLPGTSALVAEIGAGSWQAPRGVAAQGTAPWGTIPGLSAAAQFIWPDTLAESSASDSHYVIFRTTYPIDSNPPPPVVVGTITADNHYGIYTGSSDGSSLSFIGRNETGTAGNPGSYNWSLPEAWNFAPAAGEHIYVVAWDDGGPQGWIGQFALPDGTTLVSNAQDWEAVVGAGPNPGPSGPVPSADALRSRIQSATWQSVGAAAANGTSPWGTIPGIGSTANFIWHDRLADGSASDSGYAIYRTKKPVVAAVDVEVGPSAVDEDGSQGLVYTFTRSVATPSALTVSYAVGGTATEGTDFTGLPLQTGVRSITIPANQRTVTLTVFPTRDSEIEPDETVVITLQRGTSYAIGSNSIATGTIINDDLPGAVTGRGWFDANDDGSYSASEAPLSGIIVNLFDSLGSPALDAFLQPVAPTTIDAGATYRFPNLRPGSYTVSFTDTVGYLGPGTAGAVYAGIATVQLAQAAIVDLLFSQIVIPEEPPAPPVPPTAETLVWEHFEDVDTGKDPNPKIVAHTGWKLARTFPGRAFTYAAVVDQQGTVKATGRFNTPPNFRAVFNAADSWVVKGKQSPQLLEHERLHLRIAEYIAEKANLNFSETLQNITADGVGQAANPKAAKDIAKATAL